jgi:hypothetical protein
VASPTPLDALIDSELRPAVAAVVHQLVLDLAREELARLTANGEAVGALAQVATPAAPNGAVKTCTRCGKTAPADQFARQRRVCRACRNADSRASQRRKQVPAPDPAQPPGAAPSPA